MGVNGTLTDKFAARLRSEIRSGRWRDRALPSERALAERFRVSRVTIRRALKLLCAERLVEPRAGRGYYVVPGALAAERVQGGRAVLFLYVDGTGRPALNAMHAAIVNGAAGEALRRGLELYATSQDPAGFRRTLAERWGRDLRGVLLDWAVPELAEHMLAGNIPFVVVENDLEGLPVPAVIQDNIGGMRAALAHIAERGHRRLALILTEEEGVHPVQRLAGYREFLLRSGLEANPGWVARGAPDPAGGREAAAAVLDCAERPTALFVANRELLGGVVEELKSRGLAYPRDLSLAVWGEPGTAEPSGELADVTHVTWDREEMGRLAMLALEERLKAGRSERMVMRIEARVVDRGSVAAPGQEGQPSSPANISPSYKGNFEGEWHQ